MKTDIHVAHSPDSDDAFMFYALATHKIDTGDLNYIHLLNDIETLNKKALAEEFIRFIVSDEGYKLVLEPEGDGSSEAPRYLLPAREKLAIANAPFYTDFFAAHQGRGTGIKKGLNDALRLMAPNLNSALPTHP